MNTVTEKTKPVIVLTDPYLIQGFSDASLKKIHLQIASTPKTLEKLIAEADALICTVNDRIDANLLQYTEKLRVVSTYSVGINHIDTQELLKKKIRLLHTPDILTHATAELALALLLSVTRRITEGDRFCREGFFEGCKPDLFLGRSIEGMCAVLVGKGRIGQEFGRLLQCLGVRVQYITGKSTSAQIERLLKRADILSLHVPLLPETHHWLDEKKLSLLSSHAVVINTARGEVIDEKALVKKLSEGSLRGAGLDVFEEEPHIHPKLLKMESVVLTPHIGSATEKTRREMAVLAAESAINALFSKEVKNEWIFKKGNSR